MARFLSFNAVSFSYPASTGAVLTDITVQFPEGWTGIAGDNGAGKTTLLRLAAGLEDPSSGSVRSGAELPAAEGLYCPQRTDTPPLGVGRLFLFRGPGGGAAHEPPQDNGGPG